MITIVHGDDVAQSRNYFLKLKHPSKDGQKNVISYDANKITITDLIQNVEGSDLFNSAKKIFIEGFLSKTKRKDATVKRILDFIIKNSDESDFMLWEEKEISKRDLFIFKNATIKTFKLPKNIFIFLDNLRPNNTRQLLNLFHKMLNENVSEELILFMLQKRFRLLLSFCDPSETANSEEVTKLASWQSVRLINQAKLFKLDTLKKIYQKIYKIELGQKTGTLPLSLSQSIDFLLLEM